MPAVRFVNPPAKCSVKFRRFFNERPRHFIREAPYEAAKHAHWIEDFVNVGGKDIPIAELATMVAEVVEYQGEIRWDRTKPDGTPRKLLDCGRLTALGWAPRVPLKDGIGRAYRWYEEQERFQKDGTVPGLC